MESLDFPICSFTTSTESVLVEDEKGEEVEKTIEILDITGESAPFIPLFVDYFDLLSKLLVWVDMMKESAYRQGLA